MSTLRVLYLPMYCVILISGIIIMNRRLFLMCAVALGAVIMVTALPLRFSLNQEGNKRNQKIKANGGQKVTKSDAEWNQALTPEQSRIMREKGTERPFSSPLNDEKD